jgi:glycosyltransferase involved in cell wall biosynthesis
MSKAGLVGMMAAWLAGVPLRIYTNHGVAFSSATGWKRTALKMLERLSCGLASHVHCISFSVARLMVAERCCKEQKIRVLAHGSCGLDAKVRFNPDRVTPEARQQVRRENGIPPDALVLGFVGRVAKLKGVDDLASAWQVLKKRHPNLHLLIVGGVDPRNPIHPQTDALLRADSRVHFSGDVADTVPYYCAMDVQVLPSFHEGLPISLLEGAAMQLPLVASRIPGNVEAVRDGVTGTLFPVRDVSALIEALSSYLMDPLLRRKHGLAGRMYVLPNFQRDTVWQAWYQEYLSLLQQAGMSVPYGTQPSMPMVGQERRAA